MSHEPQIAAVGGVESRAAHHFLLQHGAVSALLTSTRCLRPAGAASRRKQRMALGRLHPSAPRPEPWVAASRRDRVPGGPPLIPSRQVHSTIRMQQLSKFL